MTVQTRTSKPHPLKAYIDRLLAGGALLPDSPENVTEVVGILKSYGIVIGAYAVNLKYVADHQFLVIFPFFKYFNGEITPAKLFKHWWHDRINYEYAEYCMRGMMWHGGGGLEPYLDSDEFKQRSAVAIAAKFKHNPLFKGMGTIFKEFWPEQVRQLVYTSALGQFWTVMSKIFLELSDRYDAGEIKTIPDVVQHILDGLVADAALPITYHPIINGKPYEIIPESAGITFLMDAGVPYVEAIFFRGTPFQGVVSFNAQADQIPIDQSQFCYGALYADPVPIGGSGIPPTLLMQDMRHYLPDYLTDLYHRQDRDQTGLRVTLCQSFQKSMYCVTTAAILGLAPHPINTADQVEQEANRAYLKNWMNRFIKSRLGNVQGTASP
jgi:CO2 hydration protein